MVKRIFPFSSVLLSPSSEYLMRNAGNKLESEERRFRVDSGRFSFLDYFEGWKKSNYVGGSIFEEACSAMLGALSWYDDGCEEEEKGIYNCDGVELSNGIYTCSSGEEIADGCCGVKTRSRRGLSTGSLKDVLVGMDI